MSLILVKDLENLQKALLPLMQAGGRIALVPTMGALHAGHMALVARAKEAADVVILSIFVNPKQFGKGEDFSRYPRNLEQDLGKAESAGAAIVYAPAPEDIYPPDFSASISAGALGNMLEGKFRPGHFDGVATVVTKLLLRTLPHVAVFGEKDYQQLCVIRRIVADLDIGVDILDLPIVREADGLAMSSRNAYLTPQERAVAPKLYGVLNDVAHGLATNGRRIKSVLDQGIAALTRAGFRVDYLELCDAETLAPAQSLKPPARLLVAAWLGNTRLIDNIAVE